MEIPEDIQQTATRFAGEYLAHDISCERLYRDVAELLVAERARCAKVALSVAREFAAAGLDAHSIGASRVGDGILDAALSTPLASEGGTK